MALGTIEATTWQDDAGNSETLADVSAGRDKGYVYGDTAANIQTSFNVSSSTDQGVGDYFYSLSNDSASNNEPQQVTATTIGGAFGNRDLADSGSMNAKFDDSSNSAFDVPHQITLHGTLA